LSFLEQDKELLLVHTNMDKVFLSKSVNVMVTPQFYTVKKETLPVKYAYQAKKIAASLFDGLLDEEGSYEYEVIREEEHWIFIAYDIEKIIIFLESKGIFKEKISKFFFAQQALGSFTKPLVLNEKEALVVLDSTLVVVPKMALVEEELLGSLLFSNTFTPKKGISLQGAMRSLLTQTQAFSFASVFLLFAGIFFVESSRYGIDGNNGAEELETLYASYPGLKSTYARNDILKKFKSIDKKERAKRDIIKNISKWVSKDVKLNTLSISEKKFQSSLIFTSTQTFERVKSLAKKAHYKVKNGAKSKELMIEGVL